MRATVVNVAQLGGDTLFSPVPAHGLMPGDVAIIDGRPRRIRAVRHLPQTEPELTAALGIHPAAPAIGLELEPLDPSCRSRIAFRDPNRPIMRAVGARAGGVL